MNDNNNNSTHTPTLEEQRATYVSEGSYIDRFEKFLREFKDSKTGSYKYTEQIERLRAKTHDKNIYIDQIDLPDDIFDLLFKGIKCEYYLSLFYEAVVSIYKDFHKFNDIIEQNNSDDNDNEEEEELDKISVKLVIDDEHAVIPIKDVSIDQRGKIVVFDATIVSTSEIKSALKIRKYKCHGDLCGRTYSRPIKQCTNSKCKSKDVKFSLFDSKFTEYQLLELQERVDNDISSRHLNNINSVPIKLDAKVYGDLVNKYRAGDNVRITGFPKLNKNVSDKTLTAELDEDFSTDLLFDLVVEVHNIQMLSSSQDTVTKDPSKILSDKDIEKIFELRKKYKEDEQDDILTDIFVNSFANYIYGYEYEKEFILYQVVGSIPISLSKTKVKRPDINGILIGDPGTTKSSLLEEAVKLSLHGIYAVGKGSSGVGLTASVDKDGGKGINKLKVGAAVIADKGLCAIDEYLHISDDDRAYLLECMEQGSFHINKNGINAKLNTRAAFLVATNSVNGKYIFQFKG